MKEAKWIWCDRNFVPNSYADFQGEFELENGSAEFLISAETDYVLFVNGLFVSCGQYHDCENKKVYDELDITRFVKKGKNSYFIKAYAQRTNCCFYYDKGLGLAFEIVQGEKSVAFSDKNVLSRPSCDYRSGKMCEITGQLGYSFYYDARMQGFDEFSPSMELKRTSNFIKRPIKKLTLKENFGTVITQGIFKYEKIGEPLSETMAKAFLSFRYPQEISNRFETVVFPCAEGVRYASDGSVYLLVDFRRTCAGYVSFELEAPEGTKIDVAFGEHLDDLRVRSNIFGRHFCFEYVCSGKKDHFVNYLKRLGFRYLQLNIHSSKFVLYNVSVYCAEYPFRQIGYNTADRLNQKIYETAVQTLKVCAHEHYEDTPWREQGLYGLDSRNQMLCGYYCFEEYALPRASLELFLDNLRSNDGMVRLTAPSKTDLLIPFFNLIFLLQVYEYVVYSGDKAFFLSNRTQLYVILNHFIEKIDDRGLVKNFPEKTDWNFFEWTDGLEGNFLTKEKPRYACPLNVMLLRVLKSFAALECGIQEQRLLSLAKQLDKALQKYFYIPEKKVFCTFMDESGLKYHFCELTNSLVLFACNLPQDCRNNLLSALMAESAKLIKISLSHSVFKYEALLRQNDDAVYKYMEEDVAKTWGAMLFDGATTFYETVDGANAFHYAGSRSHGWSAIPIYVYHRLNLMQKNK